MDVEAAAAMEPVGYETLPNRGWSRAGSRPSGLGVEFQQPSTWIGVTSLAAPGYIVEVDAVAVLP